MQLSATVYKPECVVLMLYITVNNFSVMFGCFLGLTSAKQRIKCPTKGHQEVSLVKHEPASPQGQVEHYYLAVGLLVKPEC